MSRGPGSGGTRVVFFGSGTFALPILDALRSVRTVDLVAVASAPDRPAGRGQAARSTPVTTAARAASVAVLQPVRLRDAEAIAAIAALNADLGVLADYGRIVPPAVLELPPRGFLNVHPSLLPRHRGASPIPAAILANDVETGVSIIEMDAGVDDGPVVAQARHSLRGDEIAPELEARLAGLAADLLLRTLGPWLEGSLRSAPQDDGAATLTRPLRREDGRLDPELGASALQRRVRAYAPWPGSYVDTESGRLNVDAATVVPSRAGDPVGTLVAEDDGLALATADGRLRLDEVRLAGARRMSGTELRRGRRALVGATVSAAGTAAT